ncbi:hypothetical protein MASR1M12_31480 [Erysipelotrichia bacterium]
MSHVVVSYAGYLSSYSGVAGLCPNSLASMATATTASGMGLSSVGSVGAVSIAGTMALPLLGALILGGVGAALAKVPEIEKTCSKKREKGPSLTPFQEIAEAVKKDLGLLIDAVVIAGLNADVGEADKIEIKRLVNEFKVDFEKILGAISKGALPQAMIQSLNRKLENFQWKITEMEGANRRLRERYNALVESCARRIEGLKNQTVENKVSQDLKNKWLKITKMPEAAFNEKLQRLITLSATLSVIEEKQCTTEILTKTLKELKDKSKPSKLKQTVSIGTDKKLDLIEQKTLWESIDYYMGRFQRDFPNALPARIVTIVEKARESLYVERLPVILDQVKVEFQKYSAEKELTEYFKLKLRSYAAMLPEQHKLQQELNDFLDKTVITRSDFADMSEKLVASVKCVMAEGQKRILQEKVQASLAKIQYLVTETLNPEQTMGRLLNSEIVCLDTKYPDFKVLLRITKDSSVSLRLIRTVDNEKDLKNQSDFQKQKDREVMGEWCKHADLFLEALRDEGVISFEELRIESEVSYYTREQLKQLGVETRSEETAGSTQKKHARQTS